MRIYGRTTVQVLPSMWKGEYMSDTGDRIIEYEEHNWNDLAEKFIEKNRDKPVISWEDFVMAEYEQHAADLAWEPDYDHEGDA